MVFLKRLYRLMKKQTGKSKDYAIYKSFEVIYLQLLRIYVKQKMEMGITKEQEGEINETIKELDDSFQRVKDWYNKV